jgi:general secretion pathway protein A
LSVVLAGDGQLPDKLRREELLPSTAGNANLMTPELMHTLCDHALGNYRVMTTLATELLTAAAQREATQLDEKLYSTFAVNGA